MTRENLTARKRRKLARFGLASFFFIISAIGCSAFLARTQAHGGSATKEPLRTKYEIHLRLDFDGLAYTGRERVRWTNQGDHATSVLFFHLYSNLRSEQQTANLSASPVPNHPNSPADEPRMDVTAVRAVASGASLPFAIDDQSVTLRINLREMLAPQASTEVEIEFKGSVPEIDPDETGLVTHIVKQVGAALKSERELRRARDINFRSRGVLLLGTAYPVLAVHDGDDWRRKVEPSIGDIIFNEAADYEVTIETPEALTVFTSGVERVERSEAETVKTFAGTALRDFAIIAGRSLQMEQRSVGEITLRSIFLSEHERVGRRVLSHASDALRLFVDRFGPLPFRTISVVEAPLVAGLGSTEFSGMNVIASAFYVDFESSAMRNMPEIIRDQRESVEENLEWTVAHLLAHQWWGAAVGNDPAREPVLDEALSSWSALLYYKESYGEERTRAVLEDQLHGVYRLYRTFGGEDMNADRPSRDYRNSLQYAAIVATKGALMFAELRRLLGDERFFAALRSYYKANVFEIADMDDLRGAFIAEAPIEQRRIVARTFNRWLSGKRGDEDIAPPDQELASSLGLQVKPGAQKGGDRNAFTAFARMGKFFWQQMTRIH